MGEPPAKVAEPPKLAEPPAKVTEPPAKVAEPPKLAEPPAKAAEPPAEVAEVKVPQEAGMLAIRAGLLLLFVLVVSLFKAVFA